MSTEILVNVTTQETRVALVESGLVQEVFVQRESRYSVVGNLYKGTVCRVLPGMQAAFVDVGLERTAFLHAHDILPTGDVPIGEEPAIQELVHEGQEVLVQVVKDPLGTKGARLTTQLSIPSRYLVLLPYSRHVGISARIEDDAERTRLKQTLESVIAVEGATTGFIVRTAGEGASEEALRADVQFLMKLWDSIRRSAKDAPKASMVATNPARLASA